MSHAPPPVPAIEITLASRGTSKGLAQTKGPQAVLRGEVSVGPIYLGSYLKNLTSTSADGETGVVVGARHTVGGWDLAASATWRIALAPAAGSDDQSLDLAGSVSRKIGRLTPRVSVIWSPDDLGSARRSVYYEASAGFAASAVTSITAAVGRRERVGAVNYVAFNVGIAEKIGRHATADLRYYATDRHALGYTYQPGPVASIRFRF